MTREKHFRDDINGLRAWAVVSVILFHFGVAGFSGGFVGVDIFFVISGYLMTGIIIKGLEKSSNESKNEFSLIQFYLARARRIIPALLALCVVLLVAGWFFLPDSEYRSLGTHSTTALAFLSNFKFWSEAGYFDVASHEKWLLHTWSLSVEWQFYVLLPIVLFLTWKIAPGRKPLALVIAAALVASFSLSAFTSATNPSAAFYLLHTRAWEMLTGGMAFLVQDKVLLPERLRKLLYSTGFIAITLSILVFDSLTVWPGAGAALPVLGTAAVILAARQNAVLTGHPILQRLGDWSYSLYLWHWPLSVILVYLSLQTDIASILICLTLTVGLGWASFRYIETPVRKLSTSLSTMYTIAAFSTAVFAAALPGVAIYLKNGMPGRLDPVISSVFAESQNKNPRRDECHINGGMAVPECTYGGEDLGAIVIGDSHAAAVIRSIEKSLPEERLHVLDWTLASCPTIFGLKRINDSSYMCGDFLSEAYSKQKAIPNGIPLIVVNRLASVMHGQNEVPEALRGEPDRYVNEISESWPNNRLQDLQTGFVETICAFSEYRPVYIVKPIPELIDDVPKTMGRALQTGNNIRVSISLEEYGERERFAIETQKLAAEQCGATLLDPTPYLCNSGRCWGDVEGLPIYYDDDHLSERGGSQLIPMFREVFN